MRSNIFSVFDIIGPKMIGPSSSHTAGAAKIGKVARRISKDSIKKVSFLLHGSFAKTYKGHGTDRALLAGLLGLEPNDEELSKSLETAKQQGIEYKFMEADLGEVHPNTVKIVLEYEDGKKSELIGSSVGGGSIKIIKLNGIDVEFTGEYPALIIKHIDKPGVIADVAKIMSGYNINIASMNVFRRHRGEEAFMIIETDHVVVKEAVDEIRTLADIASVYVIEDLKEV